MTPVRSAAVALLLSTAAASAQTWFGEAAQGTTSAGVEAGGVLLELNCAADTSPGSNALYLFVGGSQTAGPVIFQIGRWPSIPLEFDATGFRADTRQDLEDFAALIDLLRRGNTAEATTATGSVSIPLRGSSRALATCDTDAMRAAAAALPEAAQPEVAAEEPATDADPAVAQEQLPAPELPADTTETAEPLETPQPEAPVAEAGEMEEVAEPAAPETAPAADEAAPEPETPQAETATDTPTTEPQPTPAEPEVAEETDGDRLTPIEQIEAALTKLGYDPGPRDGQIDEALNVAIATWQRDSGREITGGLMDDEFRALLLEAEAAPGQ